MWPFLVETADFGGLVRGGIRVSGEIFAGGKLSGTAGAENIKGGQDPSRNGSNTRLIVVSKNQHPALVQKKATLLPTIRQRPQV